jgi:hypothetical protein
MLPKKLADLYIEKEFGWRPFVGDLQKLADLSVNYDAQLQKAMNRNGEWVTRRFFEDELTTSTLVTSTTTSGLNVQTFTAPSLAQFCTSATLSVYRETYMRVWYEGSFRYYYRELDKIPPDKLSALVHMQRLFRMYGLRISPSLIYRVTPWTWLADWFVNVGDNLQKMEDHMTGNVVARRMNLMRRCYDRFRYNLVLHSTAGPITLNTYRSVETKRRVNAQSYFSFSATANLSDWQLSMLAALGLSKR